MAKVCQSKLVAAGEVFSSLTRPQHWQLCDTVMTYSQSEVCVSWCYCEKAGIEAFLLFIYLYIYFFICHSVFVQWVASVIWHTCLNMC